MWLYFNTWYPVLLRHPWKDLRFPQHSGCSMHQLLNASIQHLLDSRPHYRSPPCLHYPTIHIHPPCITCRYPACITHILACTISNSLASIIHRDSCIVHHFLTCVTRHHRCFFNLPHLHRTWCGWFISSWVGRTQKTCRWWMLILIQILTPEPTFWNLHCATVQR